MNVFVFSLFCVIFPKSQTYETVRVRAAPGSYLLGGGDRGVAGNSAVESENSLRLDVQADINILDFQCATHARMSPRLGDITRHARRNVIL